MRVLLTILGMGDVNLNHPLRIYRSQQPLCFFWRRNAPEDLKVPGRQLPEGIHYFLIQSEDMTSIVHQTLGICDMGREKAFFYHGWLQCYAWYEYFGRWANIDINRVTNKNHIYWNKTHLAMQQMLKRHPFCNIAMGPPAQIYYVYVIE